MLHGLAAGLCECTQHARTRSRTHTRAHTAPVSPTAAAAGAHHDGGDDGGDDDGGGAAVGASDELGSLVVVTGRAKLKSFAFCPAPPRGAAAQLALGLANNSVEVRGGAPCAMRWRFASDRRCCRMHAANTWLC